LPLTLRIDTAKRRVYAAGTGVLTVGDLFAAQTRLAADPSFDPNFSQLADFTETDRVEISTGEVVAFAQRTVFSRSARRATVLHAPELIGLARMFGLIAGLSGDAMAIFSHREVAEDWLDGLYDDPVPREGDPDMADPSGAGPTRR
jgi:hypothetical protein